MWGWWIGCQTFSKNLKKWNQRLNEHAVNTLHTKSIMDQIKNKQKKYSCHLLSFWYFLYNTNGKPVRQVLTAQRISHRRHIQQHLVTSPNSVSCYCFSPSESECVCVIVAKCGLDDILGCSANHGCLTGRQRHGKWEPIKKYGCFFRDQAGMWAS